MSTVNINKISEVKNTYILVCQFKRVDKSMMTHAYGRVGQNEYGGAKQVTGKFYLYAKN